MNFSATWPDEKIEQIGEKLESLQQDFDIIEDLQDLKKLNRLKPYLAKRN